MNTEDWESVKALWEDFSRSPFSIYDVPHNYQDDEIKQLVKSYASDSDAYFFCVCLNNKVIGYFDFHMTPDGMDSGYCFHSSFHRRGYARESFSALIDHFHREGIMSFSAGTALQNVPSVRLLQSLGFRKVCEETLSLHKDRDGNGITFTGGVFELNYP